MEVAVGRQAKGNDRHGAETETDGREKKKEKKKIEMKIKRSSVQ